MTEKKDVPCTTLKVLTLNIAHGRKDAVNQIFLSKAAIRRNLEEVAVLLKRVGADIVALQEADGPSGWSGKFDHVALLAELADYPWYSRSTHARSPLFDYGTALLSRCEFVQMLTHRFSPSPPTPGKGFVLGQIAWGSAQAGRSPAVVDIVSVHLDFSRKHVRRRQVSELIQILINRNNPVVLLGDLNSDWSGESSVVRELIEACRLRAHRPTANELGTYRRNERRLDWILISEELEFGSYAVLPDVVSDHRAVVAEVFLQADENSETIAVDRAACAR